MPDISASYNQLGNFESRAKAVRLLARKETPFLSDIGFEPIDNTTHNWSFETLADPSDATSGFRVEGASITHAAGDMINASTGLNYVGEHVLPFQSSFAQDEVKKPSPYGKGSLSEFDRKGNLAWFTHKRKVDAFILSNNAGVAPTGAVAGVVRGAQNFFDVNVIDAKADKTTSKILRQAQADLMTQKIYRKGGTLTDVYCGVFQKQCFAKFIGASNGSQRNISEAGTRLVDIVDTYKNASDMNMSINLEPQLDFNSPGTVLFVQLDSNKIGWLVPPKKVTEGIDATATKGFVVANFTFVTYMPDANGKIVNLQSEA